jgi:hypothetical protein
MAITGLSLPARAAEVALFYNPAYVDTSTDTIPLGPVGEANSIRLYLQNLGHTVTGFTETTTLGVINKVSPRALLVIPELELQDLEEDWNTGTKNWVRDRVCKGLGLLIFGDENGRAQRLLNETMGYTIGGPLLPTTTYYNPASDPDVATEFPGLDATLPDPSITTGHRNDQLDSTALRVYANANNPSSAVTVFANRYGYGRIFFVGFDWFGTPPSGWEKVLDAGVAYCLSGPGIQPSCDDPGLSRSAFFPDADKDGLDSNQEALAGTSDNNPDSDGDGVLDGQEVQMGTNPDDAGETPDATSYQSLYDTQGATVYAQAGLDYYATENGVDSLSGEQQAALIGAVLADPDYPQHDAVEATLQENIAVLRTEEGYASLTDARVDAGFSTTLEPVEDTLAAYLMVSGNLRDTLTAQYGLIGEYTIYTASKAIGESFSGDGDLDGDGVSNWDEWLNVQAEGGTLPDFVQAAVYTSNTPVELPVPLATGPIALGTLLLCVHHFRRKKM